MVKRFADVEVAAIRLWEQFGGTMPDQYRRLTGHDELSAAWREAYDALKAVMRKLESLSVVLRRRAEIVEPGPLRAYSENRSKQQAEPVEG